MIRLTGIARTLPTGRGNMGHLLQLTAEASSVPTRSVRIQTAEPRQIYRDAPVETGQKIRDSIHEAGEKVTESAKGIKDKVLGSNEETENNGLTGENILEGIEE